LKDHFRGVTKMVDIATAAPISCSIPDDHAIGLRHHAEHSRSASDSLGDLLAASDSAPLKAIVPGDEESGLAAIAVFFPLVTTCIWHALCPLPHELVLTR
jgi:hypothetical protein